MFTSQLVFRACVSPFGRAPNSNHHQRYAVVPVPPCNRHMWIATTFGVAPCPRATATCCCHDVWCRPLPPCHCHMLLPRRWVSPILLPATRCSTNNDHRAQTNHRHLNMGNVVPYASKFREKRCWCNLLRCSRCIPRIVLVPMPRMQGQRIADPDGVTFAPRFGSFHFGFHYAIYFSVSGILLAYKLLMLDSFNYGPWTNLKFNYLQISTPPTMSPERFALHEFHYFLNHASSIIDKIFKPFRLETHSLGMT